MLLQQCIELIENKWWFCIAAAVSTTAYISKLLHQRNSYSWLHYSWFTRRISLMTILGGDRLQDADWMFPCNRCSSNQLWVFYQEIFVVSNIVVKIVTVTRVLLMFSRAIPEIFTNYWRNWVQDKVAVHQWCILSQKTLILFKTARTGGRKWGKLGAAGIYLF